MKGYVLPTVSLDVPLRLYPLRHDLRVIHAPASVHLELAESLAATNGWPVQETRHTYYFWQAMNPRLAALAQAAEREWEACKGKEGA